MGCKWKCKNPECGKSFLLPGRFSVEKRPAAVSFVPDVVRTVLESPCCPFCGCLEFEEVKD